MTARIVMALAFASIAMAGPAAGGMAAPADSPRVAASLIAETTTAPRTGTIWVGLHQKLEEGWHTYWRYPGDSGLPTRLDWKLPPGVTAGPLQWPRPQGFALGPLMNFGYADEVVLLAPIEIGREARLSGELTISAEAEWLSCREICIPGRATLSLTLPVRDAAPEADPRSAPYFERFRALLPDPSPWPAAVTRSGKTLVLHLAMPRGEAATISSARFFPGHEGLIDNPAPQSVTIDSGGLTIGVTAGARVGRDLHELEGLVVIERSGETPKQDVQVGPIPIASTQDGR